MSFLAKVSTFFGLEDEEYMEEAQTPQQKPVVQQAASSSARQKNTFNPRAQTTNTKPKPKQKVKPKISYSSEPVFSRQALNQATESMYKEPVYTQSAQPEPEKKVVSMRQTSPKRQVKTEVTSADGLSKIMIISPRVYSEAMIIAKHVMSGESVLVNFQLIEEYQARRIVDFLTGTVYAENGDIKRVADEIFLCTPKGTEIDGTAQSLAENNLFEM
ncbi:MAG TPA: cell division protein SepF [Enterococcus sp.]|nr:cell division protein SepF [Enterococcus sp.]